MSAVVITCPACGRALQVPGEYLGKTVQCPDCKHSFAANAATTGIQTAPLPPPAAATSAPADSKPAWDDEPPERRPARRRDRDDDDEDDDDFRRSRRDLAPDRGGLLLAIGII